jgi:hypothetical protein
LTRARFDEIYESAALSGHWQFVLNLTEPLYAKACPPDLELFTKR